MSELPIVEPHYAPVPELVPRCHRDLPRGPSHAFAARMAAELLGVRPGRPRLVGSAEGGIGRMLLTIPRYAAAEHDGAPNPLAAVYRDLLRQLPAGVGLVVLTHDAVEPTVRGWLDEAGRSAEATLVPAPDYLNFSVWAEDGYVVVDDLDTGETSFVEPAYFRRRGDALVADYVAGATDLGAFQAPLYLQGGNVLVGDDFFLVGIDYPTQNVEEGIVTLGPGETVKSLLDRLYRAYLDHQRRAIFVGSTLPVPSEQQREITLNGERWREVRYFGNEAPTRQPLFHIDMFVTLAGRGQDGRYRVLVGDPRMAAETLGTRVREHAMAQVFDNIAKQLEKEGFAVTRNPLPLVYVDDPAERVRTWYFATSNNALVHAPSEGPRTVFLPSYGHGPYAALAVTDAQNRALWERLGYEVRMLADFHPLASSLGAVHCIKKYLARG
ncbi:MAG TPA: hypothetical protein VHG91_10860 [Longimicrobium sp.]|nr:hypothetical protein [Longimicrobium sp.]